MPKSTSGKPSGATLVTVSDPTLDSEPTVSRTQPGGQKGVQSSPNSDATAQTPVALMHMYNTGDAIGREMAILAGCDAVPALPYLVFNKRHKNLATPSSVTDFSPWFDQRITHLRSVKKDRNNAFSQTIENLKSEKNAIVRAAEEYREASPGSGEQLNAKRELEKLWKDAHKDYGSELRDYCTGSPRAFNPKLKNYLEHQQNRGCEEFKGDDERVVGSSPAEREHSLKTLPHHMSHLQSTFPGEEFKKLRDNEISQALSIIQAEYEQAYDSKKETARACLERKLNADRALAAVCSAIIREGFGPDSGASIKARQKEVEGLKTEFKAPPAAQAFKESIEEIKAYDAKIAQAEHDVEAVVAKIKTKREEKFKLESENKSLQGKLRAKKTAARTHDQKKEEAKKKKQKLDQHIDTIDTQITVFNKAIKDKTAEIKTKKAELEKISNDQGSDYLVEEIQKKQEDLEKLQNELGQEKKNNEQLTAQKEQYEKAIEEAEEEIEKQEEEAKKAEEEAKKTQEDIDKNKEKIDEIDGEIAEHQTEQMVLEAKCKDLHRARDLARRSLIASVCVGAYAAGLVASGGALGIASLVVAGLQMHEQSIMSGPGEHAEKQREVRAVRMMYAACAVSAVAISVSPFALVTIPAAIAGYLCVRESNVWGSRYQKQDEKIKDVFKNPKDDIPATYSSDEALREALQTAKDEVSGVLHSIGRHANLIKGDGDYAINSRSLDAGRTLEFLNSLKNKPKETAVHARLYAGLEDKTQQGLQKLAAKMADRNETSNMVEFIKEQNKLCMPEGLTKKEAKDLGMGDASNPLGRKYFANLDDKEAEQNSDQYAAAKEKYLEKLADLKKDGSLDASKRDDLKQAFMQAYNPNPQSTTGTAEEGERQQKRTKEGEEHYKTFTNLLLAAQEEPQIPELESKDNDQLQADIEEKAKAIDEVNELGNNPAAHQRLTQELQYLELEKEYRALGRQIESQEKISSAKKSSSTNKRKAGDKKLLLLQRQKQIKKQQRALTYLSGGKHSVVGRIKALMGGKQMPVGLLPKPGNDDTPNQQLHGALQAEVASELINEKRQSVDSDSSNPQVGDTSKSLADHVDKFAEVVKSASAGAKYNVATCDKAFDQVQTSLDKVQAAADQRGVDPSVLNEQMQDQFANVEVELSGLDDVYKQKWNETNRLLKPIDEAAKAHKADVVTAMQNADRAINDSSDVGANTQGGDPEPQSLKDQLAKLKGAQDELQSYLSKVEGALTAINKALAKATKWLTVPCRLFAAHAISALDGYKLLQKRVKLAEPKQESLEAIKGSLEGKIEQVEAKINEIESKAQVRIAAIIRGNKVRRNSHNSGTNTAGGDLLSAAANAGVATAAADDATAKASNSQQQGSGERSDSREAHQPDLSAEQPQVGSGGPS